MNLLKIFELSLSSPKTNENEKNLLILHHSPSQTILFKFNNVLVFLKILLNRGLDHSIDEVIDSGLSVSPVSSVGVSVSLRVHSSPWVSEFEGPFSKFTSK